MFKYLLVHFKMIVNLLNINIKTFLHFWKKPYFPENSYKRALFYSLQI